MGKFQEFFKKLGDKWKKLSGRKKAVTVIMFASVIVAIILASFYLGRVKYAVLFSGMDSQNTAKIIEQFDKNKTPYKVQGDKILVPADQVDKLRITVASSEAVLPSHKGWELFDNTSQFGVTDTQSKVMYQRALSGEIAKAIETIEGVESANVNLVIPDKSVFTTDKDTATAAIVLKLKDGVTLSPDQVKAIIALVSRSVENLPKENVEVSDQYGNLLSNSANDSSTASGGTGGTDKQIELEKKFENDLESGTKKLLEASFGKDKVQVKVNADLNFDSVQTTTVKYDPAKVERSVEKKTTTNSDGTTTSNGSSTSPVDNNMSNNTASGNNNNTAQNNSTEETYNYEIPETKEVTVSAPGEVRRLTVSVLINGNLSTEQINSIKDVVAAATGANDKRGDIVNIASMAFNSDQQKAQTAADAVAAKVKKSSDMQSIYTMIGAGVACVMFLIALMSASRKKEEEDMADTFDMSKNKNFIDAVVDDDTVVENADISGENDENAEKGETVSGEKTVAPEKVSYEPVLDDNEPDRSLETEIKDYALRKPDQVTEIIKKWLSEEER